MRMYACGVCMNHHEFQEANCRATLLCGALFYKKFFYKKRYQKRIFKFLSYELHPRFSEIFRFSNFPKFPDFPKFGVPIHNGTHRAVLIGSHRPLHSDWSIPI